MRDAVAPLPPSSYEEEAIFKAAETGSAADEQLFLALSSTPHLLRQACSLRNQDSRSALHVAAASGHAQVLRYFLPFFFFFLSLSKRTYTEVARLIYMAVTHLVSLTLWQRLDSRAFNSYIPHCNIVK